MLGTNSGSAYESSASHDLATHELWTGHRTSSTDVAHDVSLGSGLCRADRRRLRRGRGHRLDRRDRSAPVRHAGFGSDKIALDAIGAKEVSAAEAPEFHSVIDRLCVQADVPKPRLALVQMSMPNSFATGRSQKSATICATSGILALLSPGELEGVLAHELTHVINRDVMVMTVASFFASIAAMIVQFGFCFGGGGGGGDGEEEDCFFWVMIVSVGVYAVSFMLMRALSRDREFAADRGAAVITGRPSALSSALLKISATMKQIPDRDLRAAAQMNAFFIVPAGTKNTREGARSLAGVVFTARGSQRFKNVGERWRFTPPSPAIRGLSASGRSTRSAAWQSIPVVAQACSRTADASTASAR